MHRIVINQSPSHNRLFRASYGRIKATGVSPMQALERVAKKAHLLGLQGIEVSVTYRYSRDMDKIRSLEMFPGGRVGKIAA